VEAKMFDKLEKLLLHIDISVVYHIRLLLAE